MKRVGIFGGSFNPPHLGHIHLAECVHEQLSLDEVWLVPSGISPHRSMEEYAPDAERYAMCCLVAEDCPWMKVDDYELQCKQVGYTVNTVRHYAALYPQTEFYLMVGGDMLESFHQWYCWKEILRYVALAAIARQSGEYERLLQQAEWLRQFGKIFLLNVESFDISSTKIRKLIQKKGEYACYLPEKIVQYIQERKLYGGCDVDCTR